MDQNDICRAEYCTGCGACAVVCPRSSIELTINSMGAIQPSIDYSTCVNCNACRNVCPIINADKLKFNEAGSAYYAVSKDTEIYSNASSGGIATQIAAEILKDDNGVVYAAVMDVEKIQVLHMRITDINQLKASQKSKYVQSRITKEVYQGILSDLNSDKTVLFIGTPCQVAGVKRFLREEYDNILFVELICHGVPGEQVLREYIEMEKLQEYTLLDLQFRNKKNYAVEYQLENKLEYRDVPRTPRTSLYYHGFMSGSIYRQSCHWCKFARRERIGDVTLGDTEFSKDGYVYSSVIIYSDKGRAIFKKIINNLQVEKVNVQLMLESHAQLNAPVPVNEEQERFVHFCKSDSIQYALKNMNRKKTLLISVRKNVYRNKKLWDLFNSIPLINKIIRY